jgi:hypothetical protein
MIGKQGLDPKDRYRMIKPTYGIVGGGRMATHMARYLELESLAYSTWCRGMDCAPAKALGDVPVILLAVSDGPSFDDIFPGLPNRSWAIGAEHKPLYHALCVMAGNFPTLLWSKVTGEFEGRLGLPGNILRPYLARTLENTSQNGSRALTGPLARGDRGTVQRNLAALGDDTYTDIYRAFARSLGMQEI